MAATITSLLSLATKLLRSITATAQAPSSNSNNSKMGRARAAAEDLKRLMVTLEGIKATLLDAEVREITDHSVRLWLKELKKVAYDAEDLLGEYWHEVLRFHAEAGEALSSHKGKQTESIEYIVPIPDGMADQLNKIISQFDHMVKDYEALQLRKSDWVSLPNNKSLQLRHILDDEAIQLRKCDWVSLPNKKTLRLPTSHLLDEVIIFGRDGEIEEVINLLLCEKEKSISVISIVGISGIGKTTIAQLVYKDGRVSGCFDLFGWAYVSEEFNVERLTEAIIESVSKINYGLTELISLQEKLAEIVKGKTILLVLDDVWNTNQSLWQLFLVPFKEAKMVRILVTTRNKKVAEVMQTTACLNPTNLLEDLCWQLFQHYAFSGTSDTVPTHLVDMFRDIIRKCGGLPFAVISIASFWHENKENLINILEDEILESKPSNDIFPALQINYAHLPTHHSRWCFSLANLFEYLYWQLFQHYALSGTSDIVPTHLVDIEREIMGKCGGLPLTVKQSGGLFKHETKEKSWREILESGFWDSLLERLQPHTDLKKLQRLYNFAIVSGWMRDPFSLKLIQSNYPKIKDIDFLPYKKEKSISVLSILDKGGLKETTIAQLLPLPTSYMVDKARIFGRDAEKKEVIDFLLSEKEKSFSVISIVGKGGLGKTTIAELIYKDTRASRCFDLFGWVCVSEGFDVRRLIKATVESISKIIYGVNELSPLEEELAKTVKGKTVLLVLDDVWNENQSLWQLFCVPFKEAKMVRVLVTTRNKKVAEVMQTTACLNPTNLPEDLCWQLFQHYAFSDTSDTVPTHLVDMGRDIMRKCSGLPLAVKLIASLLRHENEENWVNILESDIWKSNSSDDIFPALQISYTYLPTHLQPCFLFCSMYPKDYLLEKKILIELWISHGYIEFGGKKRITEIGVEYYEELKERSLLDDFSNCISECWELQQRYSLDNSSGQFSEFCKLHDIIHDLARYNSEKEHSLVEINQPLDIQKGNFLVEAHHLYAGGFMGYVNLFLQQNQQNLKGLRTLSMDLRGCSGDLEHQYCINNTEAMDLNSKLSEYYEECSGEITICNLIKLEALVVLELKGYNLTKIPDSISMLNNLVYLGITSPRLKMLPLSISLLYNLQTLILDCFSLEYLPECIGNLANLQFLYIQSGAIKKLPKSLCSLSNLLRLVIRSDDLEEVPLDLNNLFNLYSLTIRSNRVQALPNTIGCLTSLEELNLLSLGGSYDDLPYGKLDYVPRGIVNFPAIKTMAAWLGVRTLNWLKDMKELEGKLSIGGLKNMSNLEDAEHANMRNKCKLETLDLCWDPGYYISPYDVKSELRLSIIPKACEGRLVGADDVVSFSLLECLQPHPNLKKLLVRWYPSATVPNWMRDPSSFRSIQEVLLECCVNIQSLPFENFHTLKHLTIVACSSIQVLHLEKISSQLEKLKIVSCDHLELITGLGDLDMLAALEIYSCHALKSLMMGGLQLVLSTETFGDFFHEKPHIGQQSIPSLRRLQIENCYLLHFLPDGLIPPEPCYVCVRGCGCPDLKRNLTSAINETSCSCNLWRWR